MPRRSCVGLASRAFGDSELDIWAKEIQTSNTNILDLNTEPVGLKPPTFSSDSVSTHFKKKAGHPLALLCQGQAYPVPSFK